MNQPFVFKRCPFLLFQMTDKKIVLFITAVDVCNEMDNFFVQSSETAETDTFSWVRKLYFFFNWCFYDTLTHTHYPIFDPN
jgi:hypothetical protein